LVFNAKFGHPGGNHSFPLGLRCPHDCRSSLRYTALVSTQASLQLYEHYSEDENDRQAGQTATIAQAEKRNSELGGVCRSHAG